MDAPAACAAVLDAVLHRAKRSGRPVAVSSFRPPAAAMPSELNQPRRAPPLLHNRPLSSIEAFRDAERS
eukprot:3432641-Pleurochrysis_carterae.AAC.1